MLTQAKPVISLSPQREVVETPLGGNPFLAPPAPPLAILAVMDSVPWVADGEARGRGWRSGEDGGGGGGASGSTTTVPDWLVIPWVLSCNGGSNCSSCGSGSWC